MSMRTWRYNRSERCFLPGLAPAPPRLEFSGATTPISPDGSLADGGVRSAVGTHCQLSLLRNNDALSVLSWLVLPLRKHNEKIKSNHSVPFACELCNWQRHTYLVCYAVFLLLFWGRVFLKFSWINSDLCLFIYHIGYVSLIFPFARTVRTAHVSKYA